MLKKITRIIILLLVGYYIIFTVGASIKMTFPVININTGNYPESFTIQKENKIAIQSSVECSGFSSAYVLRYFDVKDAEGFKVYDEMPDKDDKGLVTVKSVRKVFDQKGFKTSYKKGTIASLKKEVSNGVPVIVFVKPTADEKDNFHFVPVVGYDKDNIYLAESLGYLANVGNNEHYNRKVPINEFRKMWNTKKIYMPYHSYTYITVSKK